MVRNTSRKTTQQHMLLEGVNRSKDQRRCSMGKAVIKSSALDELKQNINNAGLVSFTTIDVKAVRELQNGVSQKQIRCVFEKISQLALQSRMVLTARTGGRGVSCLEACESTYLLTSPSFLATFTAAISILVHPSQAPNS